MCSFDITNMYTNIPTDILQDIIHNILNKQNLDTQIINEIKIITNLIINQNYFQFNDKYWQQNTGLPMGAPTSSILSEIFLQYLEHNNIINILNKNHIQYYSRYVDDILIIYNTEKTNIQQVLNEFNNINQNIQFTIELEQNNTINYLDLTIIRKTKRFEFKIYRKPTTTSTIIHASSCHPFEHKQMSINYLLNRKNLYPISTKNKQIELNIIQQILNENGYNNHKINIKPNKTTKPNENENIQDKWATFTYIGKETKFITKLFKENKIKIAFKTKNTIKNLLKQKPPININNQYNLPGIYKLKCKDCPLTYIGQTGRTFTHRYKEHIAAIRHNKDSSAYAKHILNTGHAYNTINETMDILKIVQNKNHRNTIEKYYIQQTYKQNICLNDNNIFLNNPIFNALQIINPNPDSHLSLTPSTSNHSQY
ncbi:uncharacterized protein LOC110837712 [Zootermopsis nevadensis]|uniref:uncharacterized protein LOC110837712 n=1 Tax=Zootermopsis nevadensis TaxID=136037 RepID=UPI000B8E5EBE|nr:uncharacterized protein LOC110837712 [Zootermopsis nevadensis]